MVQLNQINPSMVVGLRGQIGLPVTKTAAEEERQGLGLVPSLPRLTAVNLVVVMPRMRDHATQSAAVSTFVYICLFFFDNNLY